MFFENIVSYSVYEAHAPYSVVRLTHTFSLYLTKGMFFENIISYSVYEAHAPYSVICLTLSYFFTLSHKGMFFENIISYST